MNSLKFYQVDAFSEKPFGGNPAAVFPLEESLDEDLMQKIASEMNLSETAFLFPHKEGFSLRWFTPNVEVPLCGHATLASAHVLWEIEQVSKNEGITFYSKSGELKAKKSKEYIELDFPAVKYEEREITPEIEDAVCAKVSYAFNTREDLLVELDSEDVLRELCPDFNKIINLPYRGVLVTAKGKKDFDFVSRFFVPKIGINEDPVTGSAHCVLTPYWSKKLNKNEFKAFQASKRSGVVLTKLAGKRVYLMGKATTVLKGEMTIS